MDLGTRNKIKIEGGMASMTDLVFLLLIFFIIMSLMSNNQTPIDLPKPSDDIKPVQDPVQATVIITEKNTYFVLPGETEAQAREFDAIKDKVMEEVTKSGKSKPNGSKYTYPVDTSISEYIYQNLLMNFISNNKWGRGSN